jgi:hypothetical protein
LFQVFPGFGSPEDGFLNSAQKSYGPGERSCFLQAFTRKAYEDEKNGGKQ